MATTAAEPAVEGQEPTRVQACFEVFRSELDEHYARRERIIKASRDITDESKKAYVTTACYDL